MSIMRHGWFRPALSALALMAVYFGFPDVAESNPAAVAAGFMIVGAGLLALGWTMAKELRRLRKGEDGRNTVALLILLLTVVFAFSTSFLLLERASPDEFVGLSTRMDALYFTIVTMTTVGYGDVHAEGQIARGLVCLAIAFNVVIVASLVREHFAVRPQR